MSLAVSTLSPSARKRVLNQRERRQAQRQLSFQLENYRLSQALPEDYLPQSVVTVDDSWDYGLAPELVDGKFTIDYDGRHSDEEDEFYQGGYYDEEFLYDGGFPYDEADYYDGIYPYYEPTWGRQVDPLFAG